jgi:hypothetical protein
MDKRAIFTTNDNMVAVVIPAKGKDIYACAKKAVPAGVPFWVVDVSAIPSDRKKRDAWELVDMPEPDGYGE